MAQYIQWLSRAILDDSSATFTVPCKRCGSKQTRGSVQETVCADRDRCNWARANLSATILRLVEAHDFRTPP